MVVVSVVVLVIGILMLILFFIDESNSIDNDERVIDSIDTGKYLKGHPNLSKPIEATKIYPTSNMLQIYEAFPSERQYLKAKIPIDKVTDIFMRDNTTVEYVDSLLRDLLWGASLSLIKMPKKEYNRAAYLDICWGDGETKRKAIFEFTGAGAVERATKAGNELVKVCGLSHISKI